MLYLPISHLVDRDINIGIKCQSNCEYTISVFASDVISLVEDEEIITTQFTDEPIEILFFPKLKQSKVMFAVYSYMISDEVKIAIKAVKGYKFIIAAKNINNIISNALMLINSSLILIRIYQTKFAII